MLLRPTDFLRYVTIQIKTTSIDTGSWTSTGTGFQFLFQKGDKQAPFIITNKHVIKNARHAWFRFHKMDGSGTPLQGAGEEVRLAFDQLRVLYHPDPNVDLAAIAFSPILNAVEDKLGWSPLVAPLVENLVPSDSEWRSYGALEEAVMVGYPTGIADLHNNIPVIRRGTTATPLFSDYRGQSEFLLDIAVFGGSSGSPIILVNEGGYATGNTFNIGNRFKFLGVLYAGHYQTEEGEVIIAPAPTAISPIAKVRQMVHLGVCIKSSRVLDFAAMVTGL